MSPAGLLPGQVVSPARPAGRRGAAASPAAAPDGREAAPAGTAAAGGSPTSEAFPPFACDCWACAGARCEPGAPPVLPRLPWWAPSEFNELLLVPAAAALALGAAAAWQPPLGQLGAASAAVCLALWLGVAPWEWAWTVWSRRRFEAIRLAPTPPWRAGGRRTVELHVEARDWRRSARLPREAPAAFLRALHRDYARIAAWQRFWHVDFTVSTWHRLPTWWDGHALRGGSVRQGPSPRWLWRVPGLKAVQQRLMFGAVVSRSRREPPERWRTYRLGG